MLQKFLLILVSSFGLNLLWENAHVFLYTNYNGAPITEFILVRASARDAIILTILALPFVFIPYFRRHKWLIIPITIVLTIFIELHALRTGRWGYNEFMPIIPFIDVGWTPALQLGTIGFLVFLVLI